MKIRRQVKYTVCGAIVLFSALATMNLRCAKSSTSTSAESYQGLGSRWTTAFNSATKQFIITYDIDSDGAFTTSGDFKVTGSYIEYTSLFRKLQINGLEAPNTSATNVPQLKSLAYGIDIPGFAFFLKPIESGSTQQPIVMLASGACPTTGFTGNWIIANAETNPTATTDFFGSATAVLTGDKAMTLTQREFSSGNVISGNPIVRLGACTGGAQIADGEGDGTYSTTMFMTASGGALVQTNSGKIFAAPQFGADVSSSNWNGTYSGLAYISQSSGGARIALMKLELSGTTGTGSEIDVETDVASSSGGVTIASLAAVSGTSGLFRGTINAGNGAQPLNCALSRVDSNTLLACNGATGPAVSSRFPTFFFLARKR